MVTRERRLKKRDVPTLRNPHLPFPFTTFLADIPQLAAQRRYKEAHYMSRQKHVTERGPKEDRPFTHPGLSERAISNSYPFVRSTLSRRKRDAGPTGSSISLAFRRRLRWGSDDTIEPTLPPIAEVETPPSSSRDDIPLSPLIMNSPRPSRPSANRIETVPPSQEHNGADGSPTYVQSIPVGNGETTQQTQDSRNPSQFTTPVPDNDAHATKDPSPSKRASRTQSVSRPLLPVFHSTSSRRQTVSSFFKLPSKEQVRTTSTFCYQTLLFHMPRLYRGRVARVVADAKAAMSMREWDLERLKASEAENWKQESSSQTSVPPLRHAATRFRKSWESFIDGLLREWKTQNVISVLLLTSIVTLLQTKEAASDAVTRVACLLSLVAALLSLLYGGLYTIRFGTMKSGTKAYAWAKDVEREREGDAIIWNVWVLMAMPVVWLIWSILLFIIAIMAYIWRTGSVSDVIEQAIDERVALGLRIAATSILCIGFAYLCAVVKTFARYGRNDDDGSRIPAGSPAETSRRESRDNVRYQSTTYPEEPPYTPLQMTSDMRPRRAGHIFASPADSWGQPFTPSPYATGWIHASWLSSPRNGPAQTAHIHDPWTPYRAHTQNNLMSNPSPHSQGGLSAPHPDSSSTTVDSHSFRSRAVQSPAENEETTAISSASANVWAL